MRVLRKSKNFYNLSIIHLMLVLGIIMTALPSLSASADTDITEYTLDNGMQVVVIPDHRAPVVTHMVWYRVGAADEPPGVSGIAHFLEHLMFKGTKEIAPGEFSKIISRNGGQDNAFTGQDATAYHQRIAKDRLGMMMKMEADRMVNLRLLEKDVVTERKVVLEERRSRTDNDPSSILGEQIQAALYQNHPYAKPIIGWNHEIEQLSQEDAISFYKKYYAPNNTILVVAGDVEPEEVLKLAKETYGKVPGGKPFPRRIRVKEPPHKAARRVILKDPRAGKPIFQRVYLTPSYTTAEPGEAEALDLLMNIAGSGTTSRAYKKLVVEDKIADTTGSYYTGSSLDSGRIGIYGVSTAKDGLDAVEKKWDEVLDDIIKNGVTQSELDRVRRTYIASYVYGSDSQTSLARRYGWGLVVGRTVKDINEWPERLKKVTVEDIQKVAKKYFNIKNSVTGILLPETKAPEKQAKVEKQKTK